MWSSASIEGAPRILMIDQSQNDEEQEFSNRLFRSLQRSGLAMEGDAPKHIGDAASLRSFAFNCLLLFSRTERVNPFIESDRSEQGLSPYLLAVLSFDAVSENILKTAPAFTPFVIAPLSPVSPREAGLFYLKFFTELKLHSADRLTGKMVWFSFSKARELLRRRRYPGKFGVRC